MKLRTGIIILFFTLCLCSCTKTQLVVWNDQNVSFSNFETFEIMPVANATKSPIKQTELSFLTTQLKEQFKVQNLKINDAKQIKNGVLVVRSAIILYGVSTDIFKSQQITPNLTHITKIRCRIRTRLIDKSTNHDVAKIITDKEMSVFFVLPKTYKRILKKSATAVTKEVVRIMTPIEPENKKLYEKI